MNRPRSKSLLCPNCRRLVSSDEAQCPYCGISRPGSPLKANWWTRGFNDPDRLIAWIIGINVALFGLSLILNLRETSFSLNPMDFLAPSGSSLSLLGATGRIPIDRVMLSVTGIPAIDQALRWLTLLSANYLHGSLLHIIFNMLVLRQIGGLAAKEYGPYRMFAIYTLSGIAGFGVSYLAGIHLTIGASAAVCGLIGAMVFFGRDRGGAYGNFIYRQIGGWAVGLFIIGFLPGINNWGHGGGFVAGWGLAMLLGYQEKIRENLFHKTLAGICALATALTLSAMSLYAVFYVWAL
ncbi:MAG: rhomboid family intramembrane serine protease [Desulfobacterales bacterium]|nr:rhomboid family intramembrane serine protease [Desulfobacterales bacterium]